LLAATASTDTTNNPLSTASQGDWSP